eukprot:jgi/Psemu1/316311/fgenesh1_kg.3147_\
MQSRSTGTVRRTAGSSGHSWGPTCHKVSYSTIELSVGRDDEMQSRSTGTVRRTAGSSGHSWGPTCHTVSSSTIELSVGRDDEMQSRSTGTKVLNCSTGKQLNNAAEK